MALSGTPGTDINIVDSSILVNIAGDVKVGVLGVTERGPVNTPTLIGSWSQFVREFGGLMTDSDFPLLCKRALEAGALLYVSRVAHYSNLQDSATLEGVIASAVLGFTYRAKNIGTWGNGVSIEVAESASLGANFVDISIKLDGYSDLTQVIKGIPLTPSIDELNDFNLNAQYIEIDTTTNVGLAFTTGTATLTSGAQDVTNIVDADYSGDSVTLVGIHSFNSITDLQYVALLEKAVPALDIAVTSYATNRGDIFGVFHAPVGVTPTLGIDYIEGTGTYSHTGVNSWQALFFLGDIKITHPTTGKIKQITGAADSLGAICQRQFPWGAFAGDPDGKIRNCIGVVYNVGSAAERSTADQIDVKGINPIIEHETIGPVIWGNNTKQANPTLLRHANVAGLVMYLKRSLKPLFDISLFKPNDINSWKTLHARVVPLLNYVKENRGIYDYIYQGDQDINVISDAVLNPKISRDLGIYNCRISVQPTPLIKYVNIDINVTNSGVDFVITT